MKALFIGGTGIISTACAELALQRGIELTLITRGKHESRLPAGVKTIALDIHDLAAAQQKLGSLSFDTIVDWIAFTPDDIERDLQLFRGRSRQFIFISSTSAYQKPAVDYLITESTPLVNPYWQYSRDKLACEERLMRAYREENFPITIVRPSHTYGETQLPLVLNVWEKPYTMVDRMLRGKKVVVPGDGTSLWTMTHSTDFAKGFVGLMGHRQSIGHAFHITSDEALTWDQYYTLTAEALGVEAQIVHIPSDLIAACIPEKLGTLVGDKSRSAIFDNSKIKRFVPGYCATVPFAEGVRRTIAWMQADPVRQQIDSAANATYDKLIELYERGMQAAVDAFR
jgi:nucleoside-diphosphate-sugar epimerase